jgi:hypothetical protein
LTRLNLLAEFIRQQTVAWYGVIGWLSSSAGHNLFRSVQF